MSNINGKSKKIIVRAVVSVLSVLTIGVAYTIKVNNVLSITKNNMDIVDYINEKMTDTYVVGILLDEDGNKIIEEYEKGKQLRIKYNGIHSSVSNSIGVFVVNLKSNIGDFKVVIDDDRIANLTITKDDIESIESSTRVGIRYNKELDGIRSSKSMF